MRTTVNQVVVLRACPFRSANQYFIRLGEGRGPLKLAREMNRADRTHRCRGDGALVFNPRMKTTTQKSRSTMRLGYTATWLCILIGFASIATAQTVIWSDNFDRPDPSDLWSVDNGVWELGVPTFGPPTNALGLRAHSGTNCAGTVLGGNYPEIASTRLIRIPSFVVPETNQNPRLRFWTWHNFAYDEVDYGVVQVKAGAGVWQDASAHFVNSGSAWVRSSVDLRSYAGQTVQVAFYFVGGDGFGFSSSVAAGWYVDDVALETGPYVLNNPESFESGYGDWYAETGLWEWGVPTAGPGVAHGGTNCIGTILGSNYPEIGAGRLVSPPFTVPSTNQNPRLRFWTWHNFSYDNVDYGLVQVRAGTNAWQNLSPQFVNSGSAWVRSSVDLRSYAGQTVQVAFYFVGGDGFGFSSSVAAGWYVDDVALETGPYVLNNPESFESGYGDWYAETGLWEWGVPTAGPGVAHSGSNCVGTILGGNYAEIGDGRLVSPPFVVPPAVTSPQLRFWHWFTLANDGVDYGEVQIRTGTNEWASLSSHYTGSSSGWSRPGLSLSSYAGQTVQVAFNFVGGDGFGFSSSVAAGWYVDEVALQNDFGLLLLDSPIVRTQNTACVSLGVAASSPASTVSFTLQATTGNLSNVIVNTEGCWTGIIISQPNSQWLIALRNGCSNAVGGVQTVGSVCFTAVSTHSAFVPLAVNNLLVTNLDASLPPTHAFGSRAVIIANEPLLEATLGTSNERLLTLYGKANTTYEIQYAGGISAGSPWAVAFTNRIPASLLSSFSLAGTLSNSPSLFLRAKEQ